MKIELVNPDTLINYDKNPRKNIHAVAKIKDSIKEFGFRQPIVVDENNIILVGHTRLLAAKELGLKKVPIHKALGLTDAQKKAYRIMDNKSAEYADWDKNLLKSELLDLADADFDMNLTGFSLEDINKLTTDELLNFASDNIEEDMLEDSVTNFAPSNVKLVQLFYDTDTELLFREMCTIIQEHYKLDNLSDVVYKVIEDEYKVIKSKSAN